MNINKGSINLIGSIAPGATTMQNAATATGNGTVLTVSGKASALIQVTGTFVGTITFETSADGTNFYSVKATKLSDGAVSTTTTTTGNYFIPCAGLTQIRARISAYTSGNVTASGYISALTVPSIANTNKVITLADAVAITDANEKYYRLGSKGLSEEEIRKYKRFKISVYNTHNQAATVTIYTMMHSRSEVYFAAGVNAIYTESAVLSATSGQLLFQATAGGTGAAAVIKVVPALADIHSDITVAVQFAIAPASGALTVKIEMEG